VDGKGKMMKKKQPSTFRTKLEAIKNIIFSKEFFLISGNLEKSNPELRVNTRSSIPFRFIAKHEFDNLVKRSPGDFGDGMDIMKILSEHFEKEPKERIIN
jgi:hypothetical protein